MTDIFLAIVNMSISASWIVLAVLLLRLILKKAPKWVTVLLWGIVALRLICPITVESVMSLIPSAQTVSPQIMMDATPGINSGIPAINSAVNPVITGSLSPDPGTSMNPLQFWIPVATLLWAAGTAVMLIYTAASYLRIKKQIGTAVLLRENIFQSEQVSSPFVLGLIKPKIYLPFRLDPSDASYVIAHEQAHIRRRDHWWKPLGFLLLSIHWFNPLMWLGYVLLCRDIELACDEKVIREMDVQQKADYSQALLSCSVTRRSIAACPLAFGEVGVKDRVKSVLHYQKPTVWIIAVATILTVLAGICFLTNPATSVSEPVATFLEEQILEHHRGMYKHGQYRCADYQILGKQKDQNTTTVYMWVLYQEFSESNGNIEAISGAHIPTAITYKEDDGKLSMVAYWEPRDGTYYPEDIKAKFPWYLQLRARDSQRYIKQQTENCLQAATAYFQAHSESLTWNYSPMMSYTGHNFYDFDFYLDYTHIEATCTGGILKDLWADGQPEGQTLQFPKGQLAYWSPNESNIENLPNTSRVSFTVYNEEETLASATVAFTCVERNAGSAWFDITVEQAEGIKLIQNGESACFVDENFISNIGGADDSEVKHTVHPDHLPLQKIPRMIVVSNEQSIEAQKGTCSWMYRGEDGNIVSICGDASHPLVYVETMPFLDLLPAYSSFGDPLSANIQFQDVTDNTISLVKPDTITVRCWPEDQWRGDDPKSQDVEHHINNGNLYIDLKDGNYIYEVVASWNRVAYGGTASYCFRVNKDYQIHYPIIICGSQVTQFYDRTPVDQIQKAYEEEAFVITTPYGKTDDGHWVAGNHGYQYRLEITGRMHDAAKNTTYIVLSNTKDITFDMAWKAAGYSSNTADYFDPENAVIVGHKLFS